MLPQAHFTQAGALDALRAMSLTRKRTPSCARKGWTKVADCICLFRSASCGCISVDTHVKQILSARYPKGFPSAATRAVRGILQQYMFYYDLHGSAQCRPYRSGARNLWFRG